MNCPTCSSPAPHLHPVIGADEVNEGTIAYCGDKYHEIIDREAFYAMNGDPVWKSKDGRRYHYSEMDTRHVRNCIGMIKRGVDWQGDRVRPAAKKKLSRLELELAFRETNGVL